ncbi:unnamed protein product [Linum tenue]|uniref:Uncharacterized protein n=1 Tax=Linum tenue TaxID=586396 RepID=A0AAV0L7H4_9ROSI|nr:unnamed protein product [Linum tenue]
MRRARLQDHHGVDGIEFRAQTREKRVSSFDVQTTNRLRLHDRGNEENFIESISGILELNSRLGIG